jgi:hypothetical protein
MSCFENHSPIDGPKRARQSHTSTEHEQGGRWKKSQVVKHLIYSQEACLLAVTLIFLEGRRGSQGENEGQSQNFKRIGLVCGEGDGLS